MVATIKSVDRMKASPFTIAFEEGLIVKIHGGNLDCQNATKVISSKELTLTPTQTNYLFVDFADNTIKSNTSGFIPKCCPLWKIVTDGSGIVSKSDERTNIRMSAHTEFRTKDTFLLNDDSNIDTDWTDLDLNSIAPAGATGVFVAIGVSDSGTPGAGVYFKLRKPGEVASPQAIGMYPQVSGIWVGITSPVGMDANNKIQYRAKPSGTMSYVVSLVGWIYGG
jgi:hypothetical protein